MLFTVPTSHLHIYILPCISDHYDFFFFGRCLTSQTQEWCLNIWWLSKLLTLSWLTSSFISSHPISSHLISLHFLLTNDHWFMAGHCADCCTLTLWNLCFQVKVESWYRGRKRAKREQKERYICKKQTNKIFTVVILKNQKNMVGGVLIYPECL